jgi:tetratricopeptide (TPR) repeat protein
MSDESEEFVKKATELRENGRIDEALIAARRATTIDSESANAWWQLALATADKSGDALAISHFKRTVELADHFSFGWHRLGQAYKKAAMVDEAIAAWERAIEEDPEITSSMYALIPAYKDRDLVTDKDKLFEILKALESIDQLTPYYTHTLAIAYYNKGEYHNAIPLYKRSLREEDDKSAYFNLGLAYGTKVISQDLDAIDAWRMALSLDAEYEVAKKQIEIKLPKLLALKIRVLSLVSSKPLVDSNQWYESYINPFQLLNIDVDDHFEVDVKEIQRAKKTLLQEIELEDGIVGWVPSLKIDRSRAIKVVDELSDDDLKEWHHMIFKFPDLLAFLSKGDVNLFLVNNSDANGFLAEESKSPIDFLKYLELNYDTFGTWVSEVFSKQFGLVLGKAMEKKEVDCIEALLDGRRFVVPKDDDVCFESAIRHSEKLLEPLRKLSKTSETSIPSILKVQSALRLGSAERILALLPPAFQTIQTEAADLIRSISIDANNIHKNPDLAKEILTLAKDFASRSPAVKVRIEKDSQTLQEMINKEKKDEAFLVFNDVNYSITREGAQFGDQKLAVAEVETLRWGMEVTRSNGHRIDFKIALGGKGSKSLRLNWHTLANHEKQKELFGNFINAIITYIEPSLTKKVRDEIARGGTIYIGGVPVSNKGIVLRSQGWFSTKEELCHWTRLQSNIENGNVNISDKTNLKLNVSLPVADIDNAWLLHWLVKSGL